MGTTTNAKTAIPRGLVCGPQSYALRQPGEALSALPAKLSLAGAAQLQAYVQNQKRGLKYLPDSPMLQPSFRLASWPCRRRPATET